MRSISKTMAIWVTMFFLVLSGISALPSLNSYLTPEQLSTLSGEGEISLFHFENDGLTLLPETSHSSVIQDILNGLGGNFALEGIFFIPSDGPVNRDGQFLKILNILSSVSTLKGIEYYSVSHKKMRTLFDESYRIDNLQSDDPMVDLSFPDLPESTQFYIKQRDSLFGESKTEITIEPASDSLLMRLKNETDLKINNLIKVIDREEFHTILLVVPVEEGILYYSVMITKMNSFGFIEKRASQSLYNRMIALYDWFSREYSIAE